jgi:hypothetical protein
MNYITDEFIVPPVAPSAQAVAQAELRAITEATPCAVDGCDGSGHDSESPVEWAHSLPDTEFDGRVVKFGIWTDDGKTFNGDLDLLRTGTITAAGLREEADLWESYPAFLRAAADRLDALNRAGLTVNEVESLAIASNVDPGSLLLDALNRAAK